MSDAQQGQTFNPIEQLLGLLTVVDPVEIAGKAIDTGRKTAETLIGVLENFASTVDNLNRTTTRINGLLDEIEEPLRRLTPQLGIAMNAAASLGEIAQSLGDLTKRLGPLTSLAESAGGLLGFKPGKPAAPPTSS